MNANTNIMAKKKVLIFWIGNYINKTLTHITKREIIE